MMWNRIVTVFALITLILPTAAHADNDADDSLRIEAGTELYDYSYEEPGIMENEGTFYGLTGAVTYRKAPCLMMLDGGLAWGQVDYSSPGSGTMDDIDDFRFEIRASLGREFMLNEVVRITPYAGIGYRYLNDDASYKLTSLGAFGYERESNYYYSPLGVIVTLEPSRDWTIRLTGEYDLFWSGTQKSHLGYVPGYYDIENDQDSGYGVRGSVAVTRTGDIIDLTIEPFVRYWDIDNSNVTVDPDGDGWIEPANETVEAGVRLTVEW